MSIWEFLDRRFAAIHAITERRWIIVWIVAMWFTLTVMANRQPSLWDQDAFVTVYQAITITGVLNMILAFYFAANQNQSAATENTGKAFEAITESARARQNRPDNAEPMDVTVVNAPDDPVPTKASK